MLLLVAAWWYLNHRSHDSSGTPDLTRMRRSPAQRHMPGEVKVRLRDVAGIDEVKQEVAEIIDYLRDDGALGPICYLHAEDTQGAGASVRMTRNLSPETAGTIERAQRALFEASHALARAILASQTNTLHALAGALLRSETLDAAQIQGIVNQRSERQCSKKSSRHDVGCSWSSQRSGRGSCSSDCDRTAAMPRVKPTAPSIDVPAPQANT